MAWGVEVWDVVFGYYARLLGVERVLVLLFFLVEVCGEWMGGWGGRMGD